MSRVHTAASLCSTLLLALLAPLGAHLSWRPLAVALGWFDHGVGAGVGVAGELSLTSVVVAGLAGVLASRAPAGRLGLLPRLGAVALAGAAGAGLGGLPGALSLGGVSLATVLLVPPMTATIQATWAQQERRPSPLALGTWCLLVLAGCLVSVDLATWLGDPSASGCGIGQGSHLHRHLCATAYLHAAELLRVGVDNVYDLSLVPALESGTWPATAAHMAPFGLDRFGYPPPFVLLPLASSWLVPDFAAWRALWTCGNGLFFAGVLWRLGSWVGPRGGRVLRAAAPFLWLLGAVVYQSGNVHLTVFGLGLLAMVAFHGHRDRRGGLLLAGATLAKIAPGLLGVLLLVQRRWRGVGWTVAWVVGLCGLTLAITGPEIFVAFVQEHLPAVASGRAYDFLDDNPRVIANNLAPFGLPFKLVALGVALDPWVWGPRVASAYTALVLVLAVVAGRRRLDRRGSLALWALVLTVAGLRSPMAPGYLLAGVQLALVLAGAEVRSWRGWLVGGGLLAILMVATPFVTVGLWGVLAAQAVMHGVIVWLLLRPWRELDPAVGAATDEAHDHQLVPSGPP